MRTKIMLSLSVLILLTFYVIGCDSDSINNDRGFNDDLQTLTDLEPVPGTENITLLLNKGTTLDIDSWFVFDISNVEPNQIISNGQTQGWCVEWDKPIDSNNTVHTDINVFSTLENEKWIDLNYFLNIKDDLQNEDPELTFRELQAVMWSLVGIPEFDLDQLSDSELPTRLLDENGVADFSREKAKEIIELVKENSSSFTVNEGDYFAVVFETGPDKQNIMMPVTKP